MKKHEKHGKSPTMIEETFDLKQDYPGCQKIPGWLLQYTLRNEGDYWAADLFYKDNETGAKYTIWRNYPLDSPNTASMEEVKSKFLGELDLPDKGKLCLKMLSKDSKERVRERRNFRKNFVPQKS